MVLWFLKGRGWLGIFLSDPQEIISLLLRVYKVLQPSITTDIMGTQYTVYCTIANERLNFFNENVKYLFIVVYIFHDKILLTGAYIKKSY